MKLLFASAASALALSLAAPADAASDEEFLNRAMEINVSEIAMGLFAQEHGASDATRNYGRTLVIDHVANGGQVIALSRAAGIEPPASPPASQRAVMDQLMGLSGAELDQAFARRMVEGHREAIALFEDKAAEDGDVADYAETTIPVLEGHLQLAEQIVAGDANAANAGAGDTSAAPQTVERPVLPDGATVAPGGDADIAPGTNARADAQPTQPTTIGADALMGVTVYGADNETIGDISEVLLSNAGEQGMIDAVIIDVGGFLGIGAKPIAVGFDTLELRTDRDGTVYAYSRYTADALEGAPEYDPDTYAQNRDTMRVAPRQ